jgi:nitroreductase
LNYRHVQPQASRLDRDTRSHSSAASHRDKLQGESRKIKQLDSPITSGNDDEMNNERIPKGTVASCTRYTLSVTSMMTFDEILEARRSVRRYDSRPVKEEDLRAICEAARLAPSACNSQTWRFVVVTHRDTIALICDEAMRPVIRNTWLKDAPVLIVGCSKLDLLANTVGRRVTGIEYYQIDLGIAMEHMVLKATDLGLGTCWIGWFNEKKVKEILGIPKRIKVAALLAVGYARAETSAEKKRKPFGEIFLREKWNPD